MSKTFTERAKCRYFGVSNSMELREHAGFHIIRDSDIEPILAEADADIERLHQSGIDHIKIIEIQDAEIARLTAERDALREVVVAYEDFCDTNKYAPLIRVLQKHRDLLPPQGGEISAPKPWDKAGLAAWGRDELSDLLEPPNGGEVEG